MCLFSEAEKANCVSEDLYKTWVSPPTVQLDVGINYNVVKRAFVLFFCCHCECTCTLFLEEKKSHFSPS